MLSWKSHIDEASPRNVPVLKRKGYSVWSVVRSFVSCQGDVESTLADYGGELTVEELDAALSYYRAFPEDIDRKLQEIMI